jgi:hypothetical protein
LNLTIYFCKIKEKIYIYKFGEPSTRGPASPKQKQQTSSPTRQASPALRSAASKQREADKDDGCSPGLHVFLLKSAGKFLPIFL